MRSFLFLVLNFVNVSFCLASFPPSAVKKVRNVFQNETACFAIKEAKQTKAEILVGGDFCETKFPLQNRIYIPLVKLSAGLGFIHDEKTLFKWDGTRYSNPKWNKDQFVSDWLTYQVDWVTDRLKLQVGKEAIQKYLSSSSFEDPASAMETLLFAERIFSEKPGITQNIFYIGKYRMGTEVWGQKFSSPELSGFFGHLTTAKQSWSFVTFLKASKEDPQNPNAAKAQALNMDALTELGLF